MPGPLIRFRVFFLAAGVSLVAAGLSACTTHGGGERAMTLRETPRHAPIVIRATIEYDSSDRERILAAYAEAMSGREVPFEKIGDMMLRSEHFRGDLPEIVEISATTADTVTHVHIRHLYYRMGDDFLHFPYQLPFLADRELRDVIGGFRRLDPPEAIYPAGAETCMAPGQVAPGQDPERIEPPRMVGGLADFQRRLRYPERARRAHVEGIVYLSAIVDEQGDVVCAEVRAGLPGGLNQAALQALIETPFRPATLDGAPLRARVALPVRFRLY